MVRGATGRLFGGGGSRNRGVRLGVLAAEAFNATSSIHQALLPSKERVAVRADFDADVAFVGGPGLKVVAAGANHADGFVVGMNLFLGHR